MIRQLSYIVLFCISASAVALDMSDVGSYEVVHRDGHVTDFTFFASKTGDQWNIEQRKPDGSWSNVTCEHDCVLHESKDKDIARFFPEAVLKEITPSCVHNTAFAFCNYRSRAHPEGKDYLFIALVTPQPTMVRLRRLEGGWRDGQGQPVPDTDNRKAVNGFGGWLMATSDPDWKEKWNTSPETVPEFHGASQVDYGKRLTILTLYSNPQIDAVGGIKVLCDIKLMRPDGSVPVEQKGIECASGKLQGSPLNTRLTAAVIDFIGEDGDPPGVWRVEVSLTDKVRNVSVPLKTQFTLNKKPSGKVR